MRAFVLPLLLVAAAAAQDESVPGLAGRRWSRARPPDRGDPRGARGV